MAETPTTPTSREVRCPACGKFVLETTTREGANRLKCSGCHQFLRIVLQNEEMTVSVEKKKQQ